MGLVVMVIYVTLLLVMIGKGSPGSIAGPL
jgi:hypothetical protein